MTQESVYELIPPLAQTAPSGSFGTSNGRRSETRRPRSSKKVVPPTASTFGLAGTSAVIGNAGGEKRGVVSVHPAKKDVGVFGRNVADSVRQTEFLRSNNGTLTASRGAPTAASGFVKADKCNAVIKAPVPSKDEKPVLGLRTKKNYVIANAVESSMAVTRSSGVKPQLRAVDREDFGRTPEYLKEIKDELQQQYELVDKYTENMRHASERWSELNPSEVERLRNALQQRWDTLNKQFQAKGFSSVKTPSQMQNLERLEKELSSLESAIGVLNRKQIFVFDDQK